MINKRIAIIGGGPSGLFLYKRLIESGSASICIEIFESKSALGYGMPYCAEGANTEHITNVSGNEIPKLITTVMEWIKTLSSEKLEKYHIDPDTFSGYQVLPRLLFGEYLQAQFDLMKTRADEKEIETKVHFSTRVTDIKDLPEKNKVIIEVDDQESAEFDQVIICTGHEWPKVQEGRVPGYFDSPYPPAKLRLKINHSIAIRGSSLTAIDAVRTLARSNGEFTRGNKDQLTFHPHTDSPDFKITMHSRHGLLPAIRFHLGDPRLSKKSLLSSEEIIAHRKSNGGFLSLDFIFEKDFKNTFKEKDPIFYDRIKNMELEEFVESMMNLRESIDPFLFFKVEYEEAKQSIRNRQSVYWKEKLAVLSFAMNYPAKHFSAEDMQRLHKVLMPLISVVIAFVPQSSCEELIALHEAGRLELITSGSDSSVEVIGENNIVHRYRNERNEVQIKNYKTFIDCIGQRHLMIDHFPFKTLVSNGTVSPAKLPFRSAAAALQQLTGNANEIEVAGNDSYFLQVPGVRINDSFRLIEKNGKPNPRIYMMAVAYLGGFNPDYSGLDFCEEASKLIVGDMLGETH